MYRLFKRSVSLLGLCLAAPSVYAAQASMNIVNDWGSGLQAEVVVVNDESSATSGWTVEFDMPVDIGNLWNGVIVSRVGDRYVVEAADYNGAIGSRWSGEFWICCGAGQYSCGTGDGGI